MAIAFTPSAASVSTAKPTGAIPFTPMGVIPPQPTSQVQAPQFSTGSAGQSVGGSLTSNLKALPGQLASAGKAAFNFFTGSEQGVGQDITAALPSSLTGVSDVNAANEQTAASELKFIKAMGARRQSGQALTPAQQTIYDNILKTHQTSASDITPALDKSTAQVAGDFAGVAGDVLGFGTYGKAAKAMETAKLAEKGVPSLITAAKAAPAAVNSVASKTAPLAAKAVLGSGARETLAQIANPEAKAFLPTTKGGAGKTFSSVVDATSNAINAFVSKSKASLQTVKEAIPSGVKVDQSKIAAAVNKGILTSVQAGADYKGIKGPVEQIFKTPESLIHSGILNTEEAAKVKGMVDVINNWTDNSARGVLNLKEQLAPFYKDGLTGSNNVLRNIQNGLKDLVAEVHPQIKPALKTASENIDLANQFTRHLLGSNETTGETKLLQLARNLDNPALRGYQHGLIDQLKAATGHDVLPQLKGYSDYLALLKAGFPSKLGTVLKGVATSPVGLAAEGLTAAGLAKQGLSNL